jgi:hypothetical protein
MLDFGTTYIPAKKANTAIKLAANKKGFRYLKKEIPELSMAITSVLFANLEVNQITDKKRKIGNNKLAKYHVKSI